MSRRVAFVINPAGIRRVDLVRHHCTEAALGRAWEPEFLITQVPPGTTKLHADLSEFLDGPGEKLVFAVGGDGTVRACAQHLSGTGVALAIIPRGTANLFAKSLGIPSDVHDALATGFAGHARMVDLAYAEGEPFVAMAGIGVDAAVVHGTPRPLKEHLGWLGYAVAALPHIVGRSHDLVIRLDEKEPFVRSARAVVVGNVGELPGGFTLLPGARVDDGLLDVAVLAPSGAAGWAVVARQAIVGAAAGSHQVERYRATRVEVTAPCELWREVDGDVIGRGLHLTVSVQHRALIVRSPTTGEAPGLPEPQDRA